MIEDKTLLTKIVEGIQEKKGKGIKVVDLSGIDSASTRCFVVCSGTSGMHVAAVADSVREYVQQKIDVKPYNYDGYQNAQWIVLDYGTIFVHVFLPEYRERYNLEQLWSDAHIADVPDLD